MKNFAQHIAITGSIFAAFSMLLLSVANALGVYTGAVAVMSQWHMFYDASTVVGAIAGMVEAAIITYVSILIITWIYKILGKHP